MAPAAYGAKDASAVTSKMPDRGAIPDLSGAQHLQRRATKVAHSRPHAPAQAHRCAQIDCGGTTRNQYGSGDFAAVVSIAFYAHDI
jgi:hypothetical protein